MAKLHEILAAEKTPLAAWNEMHAETLKKFKGSFFDGHSKSLHMIEDTEANRATQGQNREEKPVTTTVYDTLDYVFEIFGRSEDLQFQKNQTNRHASGTVMWRGQELLKEMPVDELLGLEARLKKVRELFEAVPTLDATKHWVKAENIGTHIWETKFPEETTKTNKEMTPVLMAAATKEHPAQVQAVPKDIVVGKFTTIKRSGAATALEKANSIKLIDELMVEVKQARMRANETKVVGGSVADILVPLLLESFK